MTQGTNGKLATLGQEASVAEREAASRIVEEALRARAGDDWVIQCSMLVARVVRGIEENGSVLGAKSGCANSLEAEAEAVAGATRKNTMTGPIDALRVVGGGRGLAFYHGIEGKDFVIPVKKEDGEWKLEALQEQEIP